MFYLPVSDIGLKPALACNRGFSLRAVLDDTLPRRLKCPLQAKAMQDATPLTLGQEWSGYAAMLADNLRRIEDSLEGVYRLALGGTAVGTGINSPPRFGEAAAAEIAKLTGLPFVSAPNKFSAQGAHDELVQLSGTIRTLAVSLYKIANDIRLMSCGPRAGFAELHIPEIEPGSPIMPGKVNPTQVEALTMIAVQVMANDVAVGFGGAGGSLEMNVYKPLMVFDIAQSISILADGCSNFRKFLIEGTKPNVKKNRRVRRSLAHARHGVVAGDRL
jgi:fumarate hydratase class II